MVLKGCLMVVFVLVLTADSAQSWSGNYCSRAVCYYRYVRVCSYRLWIFGCCSWRTYQEAYWVTEYFCCYGWTHNGNQNCVIPVCSPGCANGGTCISPGVCQCPSTYTGYRCDSATCSYISPCFPGTCGLNNDCDCSTGFTSAVGSTTQTRCLKVDDDPRTVNLNVTEMQVRLSYWKRNSSIPMEVHFIMADSTGTTTTDIFWTNRRDFNRLETTASSQYLPPQLPSHPPYVSKSQFGIVFGVIEVWLKKLPAAGSQSSFDSLNITYPCKDANVNNLAPKDGVFNCSIENPNFDRFLEHGDIMKFKFVTKGGGYRSLYNLDTRSPYSNQEFDPVIRDLAVEFRFDFQVPVHCEESQSCSGPLAMLKVPDITRSNPISIEWNGWQDANSGMFRYAWEVFPMRGITVKETGEENLEIDPALELRPLINQQVLSASYTPQSYQLPQPGMYSVILEVADLANNTKYVRRLVLYDPDPQVTSDPDHALYISTASPAANYRYQNNLTGPLVVTWERHFLNAFHEQQNLLAKVRQYPPQILDPATVNGEKRFLKVIDYQSKLDDHEGQRTVDEIINKRGIVKFSIYHTQDADGGVNQPTEPTVANQYWIDLGLNTSYHVPMPSRTETVTIWVKAQDVMGAEKVDRTQVSFDATPPEGVRGIQFHMNVPVEGIDFASQFTVQTKDKESGIAFIRWKFTRVSNGSVIYSETVKGATVTSCVDFTQCDCTPSQECFSFTQTYSVSNCHMMVEKESLATEKINVTADITNMAGLVTRLSMLKDELTKLNGTEAYYPPQNITVTSLTQDSVTLTWSFPPSCFARTALWVEVNGEKRAVHKDAREFAVTGLSSGTAYTIRMITDYVGGEQSNPAALQITTAEREGVGAGAIVGIVIGLLVLILLVVLILMFVLWRNGKIFQQEGTVANTQMARVSRAYDQFRKTVKGDRSRDFNGAAFQNHGYTANGDPNDEVYLYGAMVFASRQTWQLDGSSLTLMDQVAEGKFATIYKANWRNEGKVTTVAAKMPKAGFSEDDSLKMMAKINFMATQLDYHPNVIRILGAVIDNSEWGPVLVMEFCEKGQMDRWLVQNKPHMSEQVMENLYQFCLGIVKGMEYLASKKITHKRLAARNILLNFLLEPKVAGFGPQHREGSEDKATRIPAKWTAPEVLLDKPATEKSDVWSFGVVLWEIFSMGEVPYPGIHAADIGTRLRSGYRMSKPEFAEDRLYEVMQLCWQYKQSKRPTFGTMKAQLSKMYSTGNRQSADFYYDAKQLS